MNIPVTKKTAMLKEFHRHLYEEEWRFMESTEKDKAVLEEFPTVSLKLNSCYIYRLTHTVFP